MGVFYDASSEYHRSASAATVTLTHTGTVANVAGVAVSFVKGGATPPTITAVSYGGVTLLQIARAVDTATEPGAAEIWYAGTGIPSGVQTVRYNTTTIASNVHVVITTFTSQHSTYAIGSGIKQENTTSFSVSLTTGYVSGIGRGAFFGGGAEPGTLTYNTSQTLIHDWDMGAFYAESFRSTNPTAAGDGPTLAFGGYFNTGVSDDLAFAAIFVTDGSITTTKGQLTVAGLAPTVLGELVVGAPVGLVATSALAPDVTGLIEPGVGYLRQNYDITGPVITYQAEPLNTHEPVVSGYTFPTVGLALTEGQIPTIQSESGVFATAEPGVGLVEMQGRIPGQQTELVQQIGLGSVATVGQTPACSGANSTACGVGLGIIQGRQPTLLLERLISPAVGLAQTAGQIPGEYRELHQGIGLGLVSIGGVAPACLPEGGIGPELGLCSMGGLAPSLYLERLIEPGIGEAILEGRLPTTDAGGFVPVEATAEPGVGLVTLVGADPSLAVEYDKPRGHVTVKRRRGRRNYGERLSDTPAVVLSPVPPETLRAPVIVDPPREAIAALDTSQAEAQITTLETRRSRLARMRREEEELIAILMRAA